MNVQRMRQSTIEGEALPLTTRWTPLRPHADQYHVWQQRRQYRKAILPCGRRSGKTEIAKRHVVIESLQIPKYKDTRYFLAAPTYQQAKRIFWQDLKALIPRPLIRDKSEGELWIENVMGTRIYVVGLDKPERIEGVPWDGGVLDEYGNMKPSSLMEHVQPALADRAGWFWLIGVPEGRNHYWEAWQQAQTDPSWLAVTWKSDSILPPGIMSELKADLDPRTYRQEMEASFEEQLGRIYYGFDRHLNVKEFAIPDGVKWRVGMDFNVHPMCSVVGWQEGEDVYIWKDYALPSSNTDEMMAVIKKAGWWPATVYPDPSGRARHTSQSKGRTDHAIIKNSGATVRARLANPSRRDRYNALNTRLLSGDGRRRLFIHPRCKHLIKCLDGQGFHQGRDEEDPRDELGHINAALGYWIEYEFPIRSITAKSAAVKF